MVRNQTTVMPIVSAGFAGTPKIAPGGIIPSGRLVFHDPMLRFPFTVPVPGAQGGGEGNASGGGGVFSPMGIAFHGGCLRKKDCFPGNSRGRPGLRDAVGLALVGFG